MNTLQMLLTLIAIFLFVSFEQALDSQRNNEDIFQNDSREMQRAKEMLWSDHSNFCTISLKSETNNRSAFERFSVPIPNDVPASTMSSFLSQLTVLPTSSFLHFHVPTNGHFLSMNHVPKDFPAITTSSFLQRYVPTAALHVSATTATTTATMTQVPATATRNAPKYQIDMCKAT
jgi:hypothetical protein